MSNSRYAYLIVTPEEMRDIQVLLEDGDLVGALEDVESILETAPCIHADDRELTEVLEKLDGRQL